jgi:hypothetical protein
MSPRFTDNASSSILRPRDIIGLKIFFSLKIIISTVIWRCSLFTTDGPPYCTRL